MHKWPAHSIMWRFTSTGRTWGHFCTIKAAKLQCYYPLIWLPTLALEVPGGFRMIPEEDALWREVGAWQACDAMRFILQSCHVLPRNSSLYSGLEISCHSGGLQAPAWRWATLSVTLSPQTKVDEYFQATCNQMCVHLPWINGRYLPETQ